MAAMPLKLVIFDLDGTLVLQALDFAAIKAEAGLPPDRAILEGLPALDLAARARALDILDRREAEAAAASELMPGAPALLAWLRERGIGVAVLTRNSRTSVDRAVERHGLALDAIVARDDHAPKPSPDGVVHLMRQFGAAAGETVMVGDFRYDMMAGRAAGCHTVALVAHPPPAWASEATYVVHDLAGVRGALEPLVGAAPGGAAGAEAP